AAHQGNDFQISDSFWAEINALTAAFDEPGRFVTVPGYEWSGNTSVGGDHNVWYRNEGRPIYRSSRALVADTSHPETDAHDATALFERLAGEDAIVTAHIGGRYADIGFAHDAKLEPSVEVHSAWGSFEWLLEDAFSRGYRVGIVAASDGHKGRPGASYPGDAEFGSYGGLTCHLMERLDRNALFEAFRRRHHYATTGARIGLDMAVTFDGQAAVSTRNPDLAETPAIPISRAMMGAIFDSIAAMVITLPFVFPLVTAGLGYDPIWWGIVMIIVIEIGMITPPIGINVFVMHGVRPDIALPTIFRGVVPFLGADLVRLTLIILFPALVLWLPSSM
ncbi:MAG: TRAP transporter large permease subunit, partial [Pseudomonadota bacterium]